MTFRAKCPCCLGVSEADTINGAILSIKHSPKCEYERGEPIKFQVIDTEVAQLG